MSGTTLSPNELLGSGSVGIPTYLVFVPQAVPDPSPGVESVLWDGTVGPTPPPDQRREDAGFPPLPQIAQVQAQRGGPPAAAQQPAVPPRRARATAQPAPPRSPT